MKTLVIIPARAGSKGVPKKNIRLMGGIPLVAHAIKCALDSKMNPTIIVSTDDLEVMRIASDYNVRVVERPSDLAKDDTSIYLSVEHMYHEMGDKFDCIILLQPTSPLRTGKDLDTVISMLENNEVDGVISVVPMDDIHPARMYNLGANNKLSNFVDHGESTRRQDLAPAYYRNGCFYGVRTKAFFEQKTFMVENKIGYVMDVNWLANIDTEREFKLTALLYEDWKNENIDN